MTHRYGLNQLRYDLRKMKGRRLLERDGKRYAYSLSEKGTKVALTFILFHQKLCGPLANSFFHHQPDPALRPKSKLETAFHKTATSIQNIIPLCANMTETSCVTAISEQGGKEKTQNGNDEHFRQTRDTREPRREGIG
jgi:hypothetical protein